MSELRNGPMHQEVPSIKVDYLHQYLLPPHLKLTTSGPPPWLSPAEVAPPSLPVLKLADEKDSGGLNSFIGNVAHQSREMQAANKLPPHLAPNLPPHLTEANANSHTGFIAFVDAAEHQALLCGEGVLTGGAIRPINGITQIASHLTNHDFGQLQLPNQKEVDDSIAGKIGDFVGIGADAVAVGLASGGLGAIGFSGPIAGASIGLTTPTDDDNFALHKFGQVAGGALTGWYGNLEGELGARLLPGTGDIITDAAKALITGVITGAAIGGTEAATQGVITHRFPSWDQFIWTAGTAAGTALFGYAFGPHLPPVDEWNMGGD